MKQTLGISVGFAVFASSALGQHVEWSDEGPSAREHASVMVFGDEVVVFGGSGYNPQLQPLGDAWVFDAVARTWRELAIEGDAPSGGGSKRVAAGSDGAAYLFGGYGEGFVCNNDLFRAELKGESLLFTRIEQVNAPPERALHAFMYDARTQRFYVGFGVTSRGFRGDFWAGTVAGDGRVEWSEIEVEDGPDARFGFPYAFDVERGEMVLFSGQLAPTADATLRMADDLWSINLRAEHPSWIQHDADDSIGRRNPCFAFDDASDRLLVWCGTADTRTNVPGLVWIERGEDGWTLSQSSDEGISPRRSSGFGFADPQSNALVLGFGNSAEGAFTDWVYLEREAD